MPTYLLDVNVLVALAWPRHVHHSAAWAWFEAQSRERFATCPMTQCGFVRLSCNTKVVYEARDAAEAMESLQLIVSHERHVFWEDSVDVSGVPISRIQGYRQVTNAYLLGLSLARAGRFATFDRGVLSLARDDTERAAIEVIRGNVAV